MSRLLEPFAANLNIDRAWKGFGGSVTFAVGMFYLECQWWVPSRKRSSCFQMVRKAEVE